MSWIDTKQDTQHIRRLKVISMEANAIQKRSQTHSNNECHVIITNTWRNWKESKNKIRTQIEKQLKCVIAKTGKNWKKKWIYLLKLKKQDEGRWNLCGWSLVSEMDTPLGWWMFQDKCRFAATWMLPMHHEIRQGRGELVSQSLTNWA